MFLDSLLMQVKRRKWYKSGCVAWWGNCLFSAAVIVIGTPLYTERGEFSNLSPSHASASGEMLTIKEC